MGVALVPRRVASNAGFVIPKGLRRKEELKPVEKLWVYQEPLWFLFAIAIAAGSIKWVTDSPSSPWAIGLLILSGLGAILAGGIAIAQSEYDGGTTGYSHRKKKILEDRGRVKAPHAHERKTRKADVEYAQYSVKAYQDGTSVKFYLIEHTRPGFFWYWHKHEKTKKGFWEEGGPIAQLDNPTLEELQTQLAKWYDTAAELERNAYQAALKKVEVKKLVLELN